MTQERPAERARSRAVIGSKNRRTPPTKVFRRIYGRGTGRQDSRAGCFPRAGLSETCDLLGLKYKSYTTLNDVTNGAPRIDKSLQDVSLFCDISVIFTDISVIFTQVVPTVVTFWHSSSKVYDRFFELAPAGQEYFKQSATRNLADTKKISKT